MFIPTLIKTQKSILVILFALFYGSLSIAQTSGLSGISQERLSRLDAVMQEYINQDQLSGSAIYISQHGKPVYHKSFGMRDKELEDPMEKDDIFRIASQTKAITSVGIMILQERGQLLINDAVGKYLPEFMQTTVAETNPEGGYKIVPAKRKITIRDLLTHTSGIGYGNGTAVAQWKEAGMYGYYFSDRDEPIRETIKKIAALPQDAHPGEQYVYGYSVDILGALIEVVSGQPLNQFLSENILKPLKMNDTYFYLPQNKKDRLATVYSMRGKTIELAANPGKNEGISHIGQGHYLDGPRKSYSGGAGMVSTAEDYGRFLEMTLNGGNLEGVHILGPKTIELMIQNHIGDIPVFGRQGLGFGLGFQIVKNLGDFGQPSSVGEYGWGGAYHSVYWVDPTEQLVVVYLTQLVPAGNEIDDHGKLRALIYQAIIKEDQ